MVHKLSKGMSSTRGDDTKSLKGTVLDRITPRGQSLVPPLAHNVKVDCTYNHEHTGTLLCPAGLDWSKQYIFGHGIKLLRNTHTE